MITFYRVKLNIKIGYAFKENKLIKIRIDLTGIENIFESTY